MEIFAEHFREKKGKLQEIVKTNTWHFNTQKKKKKSKRNVLIVCIIYEVLLYLHYVDICLGYQNLDFFL